VSTSVSTAASTDTTRRDARIAAQVAAQITAQRMQRVEACEEWASPAVMDVLAELAADLRDVVPLSVLLDRIRRAVEADRACREIEDEPATQAVRLAS
jgi:hypothetical protein